MEATSAQLQTCPFLKLPSELLLEIFKYICDPEDNSGPDSSTVAPVLRLSAVSRRIREVIAGSPFIWANAVDFSRCRPCVEQFLRLSGGVVAIRLVTLESMRCKFNRKSKAGWQWELFLEAEGQVVERCRSLDMQTTDCMWNLGVQRVLERRALQDLASLRIGFRLSLCNIHQDVTDAKPLDPLFMAGETYPHLATLNLDNGCFAFDKAYFPALKALTITLRRNPTRDISSVMSSLEWTAFLCSLPQLEQLTLHNAMKHPLNSSDITTLPKVAHLPSLRILNLQDMQSHLGLFLENLRIASTCDISISTRVYDADVNGHGLNDPLYGLMIFLQRHFSSGASFGPYMSLILGNEVDGTSHGRRGSGCLRISNDISPQARTGSKFELDIKYIHRNNAVLGHFHPVFPRIHEQLARTALLVPFQSVTDMVVLFNDKSFAESAAQRHFFQAFDNLKRLDLYKVQSLLNMRLCHDNRAVSSSLFARLDVLGLVHMDFQRLWFEDIGLLHFDDPLGTLLALLETRLQGSSQCRQVQYITLAQCENTEELIDEVKKLGIAVTE
ncbi:hypothetical protein CVT24_005113 [Panaeolus cyanescens]|uniref:F-box domain-containing protein n=1 Tax=Panaeolus cyanescens TaxID=181874 RepID=A0A409W291_9AGAR|nr:hypothetical protein CVT24_005113 [Panaeolus cyanescens]